ncbi:hypothetical protein [Sinosporangium siamense]|uniref:Uncharacterized protein n=1 Tax=Sinosporangium siamense TaxID=1367973 RepID=A0A919RKS1_9ACTN|nr:hypothetical protein [Sinosporangium siamense]GII95037.1 hypothetical protein Ssi02_52680 [Sinosporangium siamense]
MKTTTSDDSSGVWLASTVWGLLEEKYNPGKVPSVRKLAQHIREANGGDTLSHGHIHNILSGEAANITDKTREILARFFGVPPSHFILTPAAPPADGAATLEETLAFRFASLRPEELAAIEKALGMVKEQREGSERHGRESSQNPVTGEL